MSSRVFTDGPVGDPSNHDSNDASFDPLDVWITEAVGGPEPPDLSGVILDRLHADRSGFGTISASSVTIEANETSSTPRRVDIASTRSGSSRFAGRSIAIIATLAASIALILSATRIDRSGGSIDKLSPLETVDAAGTRDSAVARVDSNFASPETIRSDASIGSRGPQQPRELTVAADTDRRGPGGKSDDVGMAAVSGMPADALRLVSHRVQTHTETYWAAMRVDAGTAIDVDAWRQRLKQRFDTQTAPSAIDADATFSWLSDPEAARSVATAIGKQMGLNSDSMVAELSDVIASGSSADRWLLDALLGDEGKTDHLSLVKIGRLLLAADLRCTRCHDASLGQSVVGDHGQSDYWSLAAVVSNRSKETFYESVDGRMVLAPQVLSPRLHGFDDAAPIVDRQTLRNRLRGSKILATAIVDQVWAASFGRPLKVSTIDFEVSATDPALDDLRRELIDDLVRSGFDVRRTLATILTSPMFLRESFDRTRHSDDRLESFAAFPIRGGRGFNDRVLAAKLATGMTLDTMPDRILGQLRDVPVQTRAARVDRPGRPRLPAFDPSRVPAWLLAIDDADQQRDHLAYLARRGSLPDDVLAIDRWMLDQSAPARERLANVWWLIRGM